LTSPSEVFRVRLREVRRLKLWTQQRLADELEPLGVRLDASAITRIERGTRGVTLDDAIAIAAALGVSPLHMFVPLDDNGAQLAPALTVSTVDARAWLRGQRPLDQADEQLFYAQTPESEADWWPLVPGPWRFENQEDFKATRAKWEREIFRAAIGGRVLQEPGPDAEDIPVRRPGAQAPAAGTEQSADRPIPVEEALQQPVATAIVTSELGVLIGRRNDGKPPWTFISGEVEPGESPADAAVREVKEETTLEVSAGEVIGERVHPRARPGGE
jgi:transcriptional regulator with XRE-family HTH domain